MIRFICFLIGMCFLLSVVNLRAEDREVAKAFLSSAEKSLKDGDPATAKAMCERAMNEDKTFPLAHFVMSQIFEAMNQPRDAIKSYQTTIALAQKENETQLVDRAFSAAKKLGPGLLEIAQADQKLLAKMFQLGEKSLADEQLETAKSAFTTVLALDSNHEKAKEYLTRTEKAIEARGDPVKGKIAAAALVEVWYNVGIGKKAEAAKLAADVKQRFSDTASGKEAERLLACNFDLSKNIKQELAQVKSELVAYQKTAIKPVATPTTPTTPETPKIHAPAHQVNVVATEQVANETIKKIPTDQLMANFRDHLSQGKAFFAKATPGTEGNQKNLALALEQFIHCEAVYLRIEEQKLSVAQLQKDIEDASMLRYACMKMTILRH
ncbi:MAG: hypothetical protein V1899_11440 [Planctomycetota bacterium]